MNEFYQNKTILITGAASGIGKRLAERLAGFKGVELILWDRNPDDLEQIKEQLSGHATVHFTGLDVTDSGLLAIEAERIIKQKQLPDILVNCAGVVTGKFFHEHTRHEIEKTMTINTVGSMWVTHAFLQKMIERKSGHIVNLGSASGYLGNPRMSVYAASKWAVHGWSESLRLEMEKLQTGVSVTLVIPSYIKTGMFDGVKAPLLVPLLETDDIIEKMLKGIAREKKKIQAPLMVRFVPLIKALLPGRWFDWIAGNLLGVYKSMDSFKGREQQSS